MGHHKEKPFGFTIVELLIVVVVIAILAAITIVSYNGISQRARVSAVQSDLSSALKSIEAYKVSSGTEQYPDTLDQAKVKASTGNTFGYFFDNTASPASYCLSSTNGSIQYMVNSTNTTIREGSCTIINRVVNPSFSVGTANWNTGGYGNGGVATATRTAGIGPTGGYAMRTEWTTAATSSGHQSAITSSAPIVSGKRYTASVWVRSNQPVGALTRVQYGSLIENGPEVRLTPNVWTRVSYTFTAGQDSSVIAVSGRINDLSTTSSGLTFDVTNYMFTEGETLYNYADGSYTSKGWSWNGSAGASASTGPAI